jgi:hypothetical protein
VTAKVVDTNVAVVANGRDTHASIDCCRACVQTLTAIRDRGMSVIDSSGLILGEYQKRLRAEGQPGVGDLFFRHLLDNQTNQKLVQLADPNGTRADALKHAFLRGTLAKFDSDDRVFAQVSVVARAPVITATDSDWPNHEAGLNACGVIVEYACGRETAEAGGKVVDKKIP